MKVLQLCKFFPPYSGGMERVACELAEGISRHGVGVEVLCANTQAGTQIDKGAGGYAITRAGSWGRLLSTSMSPALIAHARRLSREADLVHVHMPDPMAALALWLARPSAKLVVHWHSDVVRQRVAVQLYRPLQNWLLRRADAVIATSAAYAESSPWLRRCRHKTVVIPIGITDPGCAGAPEAARRIRERFGAKHIVLSLGRMTYYKGFDVLIDAAADLPDGSVIVVGGDGELLERHRETVRRKGLSNKIFFVGHIPHEDLAAYFEAATVFCLASTQRAEAYGVVLLEAMAGAKPVVTTEVPGSAVSWINQPGVTGLSVPVGDAKALAGAVNRIAADAAFADRLGRAARARYEQHLSAETMIQSTLNLYRQLMANTESETGTVFGNNRY